MLGELLRRLLWTAPTAVLVTVLVFALQSSGSAAATGPFAHLPRFVNLAPSDVRARANAAVEALREGDSPQARAEIARLGGAALPVVLPALEGLSPEPRARVVSALAPLAERMGLEGAADASTETAAAAAEARWARFWEDRSVDFRPVAVRRTVRRFTRHPTAPRLREMRLLDTAALDEALALLGREGPMPPDEVARAIVPFAWHALGEPQPEGDDLRAQIIALRARWFARRLDFVALDGPSRALASVLETQYAKWAVLLVAHDMGPEHGGHPVIEVIFERGGLTTARVVLGLSAGLWATLALAYVSIRNHRYVDRLTLAFVAALGAAPVLLAALLAPAALAGGVRRGAMVAGAVACTVVLSASRQVRRHALDALSRPHVLLAASFGASPARLSARALGLSGLSLGLGVVGAELPLALSAALVAERVCGAEGLGEVVTRAIAERDVAMLMGLGALGALASHLAVALAEIAHDAADPREREPRDEP